MKINVKVRYVRFENIKLVQSAHFDGEAEPRFFAFKQQLVCRHSKRFNQVVQFKRYRSESFFISRSDFNKYYADIEFCSEAVYRQNYEHITQQAMALFRLHQRDCPACPQWHTRKKQIKPKKKTSVDEKIKMAFCLGANRPRSLISRTFDRSANCVHRFYHHLKRGFIPHAARRERRKSSSLTNFQQTQILELISRREQLNCADIKRILRLSVNPTTILRFLNSHNLHSFRADEGLLTNRDHLRRQLHFAETMLRVDPALFSKLVFVDEKSMINSVIGPVNVFRRRRVAGFRLLLAYRRRYLFRRNAGTALKVNLFGYITQNGVGDLYVIANRCGSAEYINYLEYEILPSIRSRLGTDFILVSDNCPFHNSNITFWYLANANVRCLAFPPQLPQANLIEKIWAQLVFNFKQIVLQEGHITAMRDFVPAVFRAWNDIRPSTCSDLYRSLRDRLEATASDARILLDRTAENSF